MRDLPDFLDAETFAEQIPHEAYRTLRREAPVARLRAREGFDYWIVTRHDDAAAVLKNPADFSSARGGVATRRLGEFELQTSRQMLMAMDPPTHTRFRKLVTRPFAVAVIEENRPRIQQLTAELLDELRGRDTVDLVGDLAAELPMRVILEILGVPREDRARLFYLSNALMHVDDGDLSEGVSSIAERVTELVGYFISLAIEKRARPTRDLLSQLALCEVDGDRLSDQELGLFFVPLLVAGNETTRSLIASGLHELMARPALYATLRADRALLPGAIEEMLRYVSPIMQQRRTAARDVELRGQRIREDDMVIVANISANFDDDVFPDPQAFDLRREPNRHLSFGAGPHLCFGAALTRVEAHALFSLVFDRYEALAPAGAAARVRSNTMNLLKRLPARLAPAAGGDA
jgi:cytochrome P450